MPALRRPCAALLLSYLLLPLLAMAEQPANAPAGDALRATAETWQADVAAMTAAGDSAARRAVLRQRLDARALPSLETAFSNEDLHGRNLLATVSGAPGAPLLLIGAHLDKVDAGLGATDNASGSATVLELARRFQQRPLARHRVAVAFWDLEEKGLLGARAYVADGGEKPALYVNFDVFGWGDTLWMMVPDAAHPLRAASDAAARETGIALSAGDKYPPTDHLAFLKAGWPAVSYSLVGGDEIPLILQVFAQQTPERMPKVMRVIHSDADTLDEVDATAVSRGIDAVEAALRRWDATVPTP